MKKPEWLENVTVASAQELTDLAKANETELSAEDAEKYFISLQKAGELSDDELNNVAGGCGPDPAKVRSTDLKCDHYGCRCSVFGRAFTGYYGPEFTCPCSECGQGTLHVTGWTEQDGSYYKND